MAAIIGCGDCRQGLIYFAFIHCSSFELFVSIIYDFIKSAYNGGTYIINEHQHIVFLKMKLPPYNQPSKIKSRVMEPSFTEELINPRMPINSRVSQSSSSFPVSAQSTDPSQIKAGW